MPRLFRTLPHCCLALALAVFPSCQRIPESGFDPRSSEESVDIDFKKVSAKRKIDRSWLQQPKDAYLLGPGDLLEIEIAGVAGTLARTYIMPDGMAYYDLAGGVRAEGLTQKEFSATLAKKLAGDYASPTVNVNLLEVRSQRYWIIGRVSKPGIYPIQQPTTLLEALSQAGGLQTSGFSGTTEELGDLANSVVVRDGKVLAVDFKKLVMEGDMSNNIYLLHNDLIYVPATQSNNVLLLGAVRSPRSVGFKNSLSLIQCLAYGKGPSPGAYMKKVVIVRGTLNHPRAATVNAENIIAGKETDVRLQPGDIVWVPRSPFRFLEEGVDLLLRDTARTLATNEGAAIVGSDQKALLTIPAGSSSTPPASP